MFSSRVAFELIRPTPCTGTALLVVVAGLLFSGDRVIAAESVDGKQSVSAADAEYFEKKVRPLLVTRCHECHSAKQQKGNLRLDSLAGALKGGDTGPAVVAGQPDQSEMIAAINYDPAGYQMPPTAKLPSEEIETLTEWVRRGAPWPGSPSTAEGLPATGETFDIDERSRHWAFQPLSNPVPPVTKDKGWVRNAIDQFILAQLEEQGLRPADEADRRVLIRRLTYDLTGLPPTPEEIHAFESDPAEDAYERLVDRLLASPRYGERWARHWLDLVRFAETGGHEFDFEIPHAWPYRDYVIRAFNADVPYDQFVTEHIAGDLLENPRRDPETGRIESVVGTAFYWMGQAKHSPVDIRGEECDTVDNQLDVLGKTFLGLTIACARCHDHKFDPIRQADYYALAGYLQSSRQDFALLNPPEDFTAVSERLAELHHQNDVRLQQLTADVLQLVSTRLQSDMLRSLTLATKPSDHQKPADTAQSSDVGPPQEHSDVTSTALALAAFQREAKADQDRSVWSPWLVLSRTADSDFTATRTRIQQDARPSSSAELKSAGSEVFADFDSGPTPGWQATGPAFSSLSTRGGDLIVGSQADHPIATVTTPGTAHSGLQAGQLQGVLRSPTFTIEKPFIDYCVLRQGGPEKSQVGQKVGQIHVIVDGFHLIRNPLYGSLSINVSSGTSYQWYRQDVSKVIGHRAYIEIADVDDGWISLDEVRFSDRTSRLPGWTNALAADRLLGEAVHNSAALASAYADLCSETVQMWRDQQLLNRDDAKDRIAVINGLLHVMPIEPTDAAVRTELPEITAWFAAAAKTVPQPVYCIAMTDGTAENEHLLPRGNHSKPGPLVARRYLEVFDGQESAAPRQGSGRLQLAREMIDPQQTPLLPRVLVNRLWLHHFGRGIVKSVDNFGVQGERPTHPELLDFLSQEFVRSGWSIKQMHRLMLTSSAYRMSSTPADALAEEQDPENRLLHRMRIRRIEAEAIRDTMLAISGRLDTKMYGPGVLPYLTPFMEGRGRPASGPLDGDGRRSIYINVRRNFLPAMFLAFDFPTPFTTMGRRSTSNVPAQALALLNNPLVLQQAELWGTRIVKDGPAEPTERVRWMYETSFGRLPTNLELQAAMQFVTEESASKDVSEPQVWARLAHVLWNVKDFIFLQ